jgi:putative transposase
VVGLAAKREATQHAVSVLGFTERRACQLVSIERSTFRRKASRCEPQGLRTRIKELAELRRRYGYRRLYVLLKREGFTANKKLVYRIYKEEKLSLKIRKRKRLASVVRIPTQPPSGPNERWSMDFVSDQLGPTGRRFRCLNVVDNFTRECLAIEVDTSLSGLRVAEVLERIIFIRSAKPRAIVIDNGPEFTGRDLDHFTHKNGIRLDFIRPGKPVENAFVESFNGKFRDECLNANWFVDLREAKVRIEEWREDYNCNRPHSALGNLSPNDYAARFAA